MKKKNKIRAAQIKNGAEVDKKNLNYLLEKLGLKEYLFLLLSVTFMNARGCCFLECIYRGMSVTSAYGYSFNIEKEKVLKRLELWGWDITKNKI